MHDSQQQILTIDSRSVAGLFFFATQKTFSKETLKCGEQNPEPFFLQYYLSVVNPFLPNVPQMVRLAKKNILI